MEIYQGEVYDLGDSSFDDFYTQAVNTFEQADTFTEQRQIKKLELVDFAAQQDQKEGVDLEEIKTKNILE